MAGSWLSHLESGLELGVEAHTCALMLRRLSRSRTVSKVNLCFKTRQCKNKKNGLEFCTSKSYSLMISKAIFMFPLAPPHDTGTGGHKPEVLGVRLPIQPPVYRDRSHFPE